MPTDTLMKKSKFDILGYYPDTWGEKRLKYLCSINTGNKDTVDAVYDGIYPFYVRSPHIEHINSYSFDGEAILMAGDGVGAGKVFHYVNEKFDYHQRVYNMHNFKYINGKYLFYYTKELFSIEIEKGSAKSTVDSIRLPMLQNFIIPIPDISEQKAIADFLDDKCEKIDEVIGEIEEQIQVLEDYKKSLITETVTKGLDKNVPMKDSGIDWIGKIPQNWDIKKIGYLSFVTKLAGFEFTDYFDYIDDGEVIALRGLNLNNFSLDLNDIQKIKLEISNKLPRSRVKTDDILISYAGTVGSIGLIQKDGNIYHLAPNVAKITIVKELYPKWVAYYLISKIGQEEIYDKKNKNAQESISMENIRKIKIIVPALEEQQSITDFLDRKCEKIDKTISDKKEQLETIKEYKKSLIYEYVTGKKRVAC